MSEKIKSEDMFFIELENGMKIEVVPNSYKWSGTLYASNDFIEGEKGQFQLAANHLIEHCLSGPFKGNAEVRSTFISHQLSQIDNIKQASNVLNSLGDNLINLSLEPEKVESEKRVIFEEWAGQALHKNKFRFFGGYFYPVTFDEKDRVIEDVTDDKIYNFMNQQANYTQDFSVRELNQQARFMYGAKNLTLRLETPLEFDTFKEFIRRTRLKDIPKIQSDARQITDNFENRPTNNQVDYRNIKPQTLHFNFSVLKEEEKIAADILNNMIKNAQKESGVYWFLRTINRDENESHFSFVPQITSQNKAKMLNAISKFLNQTAFAENSNQQEQEVAKKMSKQFGIQLQKMGLMMSSVSDKSR